jgi:hypothetical protein
MLRLIDVFTPVKVQPKDEVQGLDDALFGEHAYEDVLESEEKTKEEEEVVAAV